MLWEEVATDKNVLGRVCPPLSDQKMFALSRDGKTLIFVALNSLDGDSESSIFSIPLSIPATGVIALPTPAPTAAPTRTRPPTATPRKVTPGPPPPPKPTLTIGPTLTPTLPGAKMNRVTAKTTCKNTWPA